MSWFDRVLLGLILGSTLLAVLGATEGSYRVVLMVVVSYAAIFIFTQNSKDD